MKGQYRERPASLQLQLPRNAQLVTPQRPQPWTAPGSVKRTSDGKPDPNGLLESDHGGSNYGLETRGASPGGLTPPARGVVIDPADGRSIVGYAAAASAKQAEEAVAAAHRAFPAWAARSPRERAELLAAALAPLEAERPVSIEKVGGSIVSDALARLMVVLAIAMKVRAMAPITRKSTQVRASGRKGRAVVRG